MKREKAHITQKARKLKVEGKIKRGKPKGTWERTVAKDLKLCELEEEQAQDRKIWRLAKSRFDSAESGKWLDDDEIK